MDENKTYSIIGTVTIGTDEYRDLIEEKETALRDKEDYYRKYWDYYTKNSRLEEQVKELTAKLEQLRQYIKDNNEQDKLELWIVRTKKEDGYGAF